MLLEKMEAIRSWHYKIPPYISRHLSTKSFVEDLVSPLLHILSPPTLRPVMYLNFIYYYFFFLGGVGAWHLLFLLLFSDPLRNVCN